MGCGAIPAYLSINFCAAAAATLRLLLCRCRAVQILPVQAPDPADGEMLRTDFSHLPHFTQHFAFSSSFKSFSHAFLHGRRFRKCGICSTVRSSAECLRQPGTAYNTDSRYSHSVLCSANLIRFQKSSFSSASSSGLKFEKVFRLSSTCSSFDIPLRITFALEWLPTQRNAQDAMLASLSIALNFALISSEKFARLPLLALHDHQRNSKLFCQSVAFIPCLFLGVHVVILNLAEIPVTAAQHFFKCFVGIVEGKAR